MTHVKRNRYGYTIDGDFYRRVTTYTGGLPKPWLSGWAAKAVAEFAVEHRDQWTDLPKTDAKKLLKGSPWSKRDDAADRGTAVHKAIEAYLRDEPLPDGLNEEEFDCAVQAETFLERSVAKTLAAELTVFNRTHVYAGTLDLWCVDHDGARWVLDWKTSSSDSVPYTDWTIQQAAYRNAEYAVVNKAEIGDEEWEGETIEWGPERAEKIGIVHVGPEEATLHPIHYTNRLWTVFRAAKHVKAWQLDTDDYRKDPRERVYEDPVRVTEEASESAA